MKIPFEKDSYPLPGTTMFSLFLQEVTQCLACVGFRGRKAYRPGGMCAAGSAMLRGWAVTPPATRLCVRTVVRVSR